MVVSNGLALLSQRILDIPVTLVIVFLIAELFFVIVVFVSLRNAARYNALCLLFTMTATSLCIVGNGLGIMVKLIPSV